MTATLDTPTATTAPQDTKVSGPDLPDADARLRTSAVGTLPTPPRAPGERLPRGLDAAHTFVAKVAALTEAEEVVWCDGSREENTRLLRQMCERGTLTPLNPQLRPNSYLARSDPRDVARVEAATSICSEREEDAGPTNNWRDPAQMRATLREVFAGCMRGRTLYVVPFSMGPVGGSLSQLGIELTDSPYVVANMRLMTRMGAPALREIAAGAGWVPAVHSVGMPLRTDSGAAVPDVAWPCNETKYITHFPADREIWSFGSGYGGNALLGKKCYALRIASAIARDEGWLAEHMLLIRLTHADGRRYHVAAAFPSACGKTNLAMLRSVLPEWEVTTLGDDIVWMRPGADGRLWAINPEAGFFGVAPGTGESTNPTAVRTLTRDVIFTNVARTDDGDVWWEGLTETAPGHLIDWQGQDWTPQAAAETGRPAAHPNARFTVSAAQCPVIDPDWETPHGVPVDLILFGGRRATNVPLVAAAQTWQQGVFYGATISSERTAAAEGTVGELRRDPFAMLPFCGYHMADYWAHWLRVGAGLTQPPAVAQVNWFRKGSDGRFVWPGFADNIRVLDWLVRHLEGEAPGRATAVGTVPGEGELNLDGVDLPTEDLRELLAVEPAPWLEEAERTREYFATFGARLPDEMANELEALSSRLADGPGAERSAQPSSR
ncbi:phosphoenolpyruvate carboxykinase (GTP) [Ruania halotolerans]|uniref:phosphoenolpyruvate carboxykinase (GTP) n=1 Tax=Ruania halotolerans TaxID=2897773 RepID=UPI001E3EE698|nr:phosphoenolpyruvate carboxykinase (GTP) [Ruania halotolerans]UFU04989.1 phosphoenolpyruvate carboxykinase (GTP) [Ruania halotolerans]